MTTQDAVYRRGRRTWVMFAALFAFGLLNAMLGPVLPYLRRAEHIPYAVAALHQVAFAVGGTTAGLLATRASSRGCRRTIAGGLAAAGLAGVLLGYGGLLPVTLAAALLVSAFGTTAMIRTWAVVSDLHGRHRAVAMSEGEVAVSLAGVAVPVVVAVCAASGLGWRSAFLVAGAAVAAAVVAVCRTPLPAAEEPDAAAARPQAGPDSRRTLVTVASVVALEFTVSFWAASYLHDGIGLPADAAAAAVSVLYAANLVGRVAASRLARRVDVVMALRAFLGAAALGLPLLLAAPDAAVALLGLAVAGAGIGGVFPLASARHVTASRRSADQALGQILAVAGVGQVVGPLAAGVLAQLAGLRLGLLVAPALVVLAGLSTRSERASSPLRRAVVEKLRGQ